MQELRRSQLLPGHEELVLLLDELRIKTVLKTDKGYDLFYDHPDHDGITVDMEDYR